MVEGQGPDGWSVRLPGWDLDSAVKVNRSSVPEHMRNIMFVGFRCWVRANIGTDDRAGIIIEWPGPDDPDHHPSQEPPDIRKLLEPTP